MRPAPRGGAGPSYPSLGRKMAAASRPAKPARPSLPPARQGTSRAAAAGRGGGAAAAARRIGGGAYLRRSYAANIS